MLSSVHQWTLDLETKPTCTGMSQCNTECWLKGMPSFTARWSVAIQYRLPKFDWISFQSRRLRFKLCSRLLNVSACSAPPGLVSPALISGLHYQRPNQRATGCTSYVNKTVLWPFPLPKALGTHSTAASSIFTPQSPFEASVNAGRDVEAVLFDMDGVLCNSEELSREYIFCLSDFDCFCRFLLGHSQNLKSFLRKLNTTFYIFCTFVLNEDTVRIANVFLWLYSMHYRGSHRIANLQSNLSRSTQSRALRYISPSTILQSSWLVSYLVAWKTS